MYHFRLYNLTFESVIDCGLSPAVAGPKDISIKFVEVLPTIKHISFEQGNCFGNKEEVFVRSWLGTEAVVREGTEILIKKPCDLTWIVPLILSQFIPILLMQRGHLIFHASANRVEDKAVLFLGESGAGKSTATASLYQKGYASLADDCAVCLIQEEQIVVLPVLAHIRLLPDYYHFMSTVPLRGVNDLDKVHFVTFSQSTEPVVLGKVIELQWADDEQIERLSRKEFLITLFKHVWLEKLAQLTLGDVFMESCAHIARQIPGYAYRRSKTTRILADAGEIVFTL